MNNPSQETVLNDFGIFFQNQRVNGAGVLPFQNVVTQRRIFKQPGDLGQRIYDKVSKVAWQRWVAHQTMLINENRLTPIEPEARSFLEAEMEKFFFGEGSAVPKEYLPPDS